jgi:hypothetical protein
MNAYMLNIPAFTRTILKVGLPKFIENRLLDKSAFFLGLLPVSKIQARWML